jgi:hypothetical protein
MKIKNIRLKIIAFILLFFAMSLKSQDNNILKANASIDKVKALKDTLNDMMKQTDNALFINHCKSFLKVIDAQMPLTNYDSSLLIATYDTFVSVTSLGNCRKLSSYLKRQWPYIITWQSPTDGMVSVATVTLPKNWDPEKTYPVYVHLHGLSSNYALPTDLLTHFFMKGASSTFAYEDGYWLSPWGRGNLWYYEIGETDVWESLAELKRLVKIDLKRQYITGHSMGGYGSWYIASRSAGTWAALGVEAGALQYNYEDLLRDEVVQKLKNLPTYFVVGSNDGLLDVDKRTYNLLIAAGNTNTKFVTFNGAHEHLYTNDENLYLWMKEFVNDDYSSNTKSITQNKNELKCYPNPLNNTTTLCYSILGNSASLFVYNITGVLIKEYAGLRGSGSVQFDGSVLPNGVYLCKLITSDNKELTNKMVILR